MSAAAQGVVVSVIDRLLDELPPAKRDIFRAQLEQQREITASQQAAINNLEGEAADLREQLHQMRFLTSDQDGQIKKLQADNAWLQQRVDANKVRNADETQRIQKILDLLNEENLVVEIGSIAYNVVESIALGENLPAIASELHLFITRRPHALRKYCPTCHCLPCSGAHGPRGLERGEEAVEL